MDWVREGVHIVLQMDAHLLEWTAAGGPWVYVLLVVIVFCETGLVVTPFLPGDSLLFAVGALAALDGSPLNFGVVNATLIGAGVAGDAFNYLIGARLGPRLFWRDDGWLLNKRHLERTQHFYARHGGKTIVLARFIPLVRTLAPFVAGLGRMQYAHFAAFNVVGAVAWVTGLTGLGYGFGNLPVVKQHFHYVILAIIVLSMLPAVGEVLAGWRNARRCG